jgi:hypothetical protein
MSPAYSLFYFGGFPLFIWLFLLFWEVSKGQVQREQDARGKAEADAR